MSERQYTPQELLAMTPDQLKEIEDALSSRVAAARSRPQGKSLFKRGLGAAWKGVKGVAKGVGSAIANADADPNKNKDPFGNLGLDKIKFTPNQAKKDAKNFEKRMKQVQARMNMATDVPKTKEGYDRLMTYWGKVKKPYISDPERNYDWKNFINTELSELEDKVGLSPDPKTARAARLASGFERALSTGGHRQVASRPR